MKYLLYIFFTVLTFGQLENIAMVGGRSVYLHDPLLVAILMVFLLKRHKVISKAVLTGPIIGFSLTALVSLAAALTNLDPGRVAVGSLYFWRWLLYAGLYFIVLYGSIPGDWWMEMLAVAGGAFTLFGFAQYFWYPDLRDLTILGWDPHYYRLTSTFLDPNFAGLFIVLTFFLVYYVLQKYPVYRLGTQCILLLALYLTYSRSSYVAFGTGLIVYILFTRQWKTAAMAIVLVLLVFLVPHGKLDVTDIFRPVTTQARLENWGISWEMAKTSPVVGYGFNTLIYIGRLSGIKQTDAVPSRVGGGIDNSFLFLAATTGIIGLAAYLWLLVSQFRVLSRIPEVRATGLAALGAVLIHSLFNNSLFYPWCIIWMFAFVGAAEKIRGDT